MRKWLLAFLLLAALSACDKERFEKQIEGNYTGSFQRTAPTGPYPVQQVSLHLNDNSFSGQSSNARQPALCHGRWEAGSSVIDFHNSCVWTADFDWTLILTGTFRYELNGTRLKMWKKTGDITDTYELTKIP